MMKKKTISTKLRLAAMIAAVCILPLYLAGCGKTVIYKGGTDYPYEIREKANGRLVIRLDGSKSPEYNWEYTLEAEEFTQMDLDGNLMEPQIEEPPVAIKQKGKEKNGKVKYLIKPTEERGSYQITFTRRRIGTTEPTVSYNSAGLVEMIGENDVTDTISVRISVSANEKGKLLAHVEDISQQEMTGIVYVAQDTPYACHYQIDENGELVLTLPLLNDWEISMENIDDGSETSGREAGAEDSGEETGTDETGNAENGTEQTEAAPDEEWQEDYSDIDDPEVVAALRAIDEQIAKLREEYGDEIEAQQQADYYADNGMIDDETAAEEGREWYEDPNLHIWKSNDRISSDLTAWTFYFKGNDAGSCAFTANSELAGFGIRLVVTNSADGTLSVSEASYEGGQTHVPEAFAAENHTGIDESDDEGGETDETGAVERGTGETDADESSGADENASGGNAANASDAGEGGTDEIGMGEGGTQ
ncbi:MAG: hypothetical protein IJ711_08855 [Lachnospiraceae bacterium]|nr:hypothetical protein [Lachnospiraceae bacterium]